jgi:RNA polymerase sigma-70 factor (ECF subfamily)
LTRQRNPPVAALIDLYHDELVSHVRGRLRSAAEAEDIVQETWVRASATLGEGMIGNVRAYLYRIAGNLAIDFLRRRGVAHRVCGAALEDPEAAAAPSPSPSAEQHLIDRQRQAAFEAVLAGLPKRCRQALVLSRIEGWTQARIAAHLGVSPNTVASDIRKALELCLARSAELDV